MLRRDSKALEPVLYDFLKVCFYTRPLFVCLPPPPSRNRFWIAPMQEMGIDWSIREGYAWVEDKEHCEEYGRMLQADPTKARLVRLDCIPHASSISGGGAHARKALPQQARQYAGTLVLLGDYRGWHDVRYHTPRINF